LCTDALGGLAAVGRDGTTNGGFGDTLRLRLATYAGSRGTGSPSLLFREDSFLDSTDARR
jgi:hypothetical protein